MTDADPEALAEQMLSATEQEMTPLIDWRDDRGLYEVVIEGDDAPSLVKEYHGHDVVPRAIQLVDGGVRPDEDLPTSFVDPYREHTRLVVSDAETGVDAVRGAVDMGTFWEVETDD